VLEKGGSSQDASYVKMQFAAKTLPTLKEPYAVIKKIGGVKS
jgi:hypothetical protein